MWYETVGWRMAGRKLIQLIGPQDCGKTELRRSLCPGAIDITSALHAQSGFNKEMLDAPGYYFDLDCIRLERHVPRRLRDWIMSDEIVINRMCDTPVVYRNPGIWICEGRWPLHIDCPTFIWHVRRDPAAAPPHGDCCNDTLCNAATSLLKRPGVFAKFVTMLKRDTDMRDDRIDTLYDAVFYKLLEMMS
jgi:hypothetical protein